MKARNLTLVLASVLVVAACQHLGLPPCDEARVMKAVKAHRAYRPERYDHYEFRMRSEGARLFVTLEDPDKNVLDGLAYVTVDRRSCRVLRFYVYA